MPIQKLSPNFEAPVGVEANNYQYNGIEIVEDFGLHVNHAEFRTLNPQTGAWWQIDPMAEKFYAWSPYNSNLDNPIKHSDPKGDFCFNCLVGAAVGGGVEYAFQIGTNISEGKSGLAIFEPEMGPILVSMGAGLLTGGFSTVAQIESKLVALGYTQIQSKAAAFGANRLVDGTVGVGESVSKQSLEVLAGEKVAISMTEAVRDGSISVATGAWGEGGEMAAKSYLKEQYSGITDVAIAIGAEGQENGIQKIATATVNENNTCKNSSATSQPTNTSSQRPSTGNRMANPQPVDPLQ